MVAAIAFVVLTALLLVFQLALALGAPWGRLAWGGQHAGVLPTGYRIGSLVTIVVYAFLASVVLDRGGVTALYPEGFAIVACWVVFGVLALGTLMNAVSRSKPERTVMTPVALVLAVLALLIAIFGSSALS